MLTFATAYLLVWFAVLVYVLRLGAAQRRLLRIVQTMQAELSRTEKP
jgi:CcmD family protein